MTYSTNSEDQGNAKLATGSDPIRETIQSIKQRLEAMRRQIQFELERDPIGLPPPTDAQWSR